MLTIYPTTTLSPTIKEKLFARSAVDYQKIIAQIQPKIAEVQTKGDAAILEKYQARSVPISTLRVSKEELQQGYKNCSQAFLDSLEQASRNILAAHTAQKERLLEQEVVNLDEGSIQIWRRWLPVRAVGIYVPGGRANYPSSLLMSAIPAQLAGCSEVVVCVPPRNDGTLPNEVLAAAYSLGITQLFKIGGAQAIAAMAMGTETVPKVQTIVGPGNQYVTAAKLALFPQVNIDSPAGPSENIIIADASANPTFIAADIMADAEHAPDSTSIVVTDSPQLAKKINQELQQMIEQLPTKQTILESFAAYGAILVTKNLTESIALANEYAPEHLQIMTKNPVDVAMKITNAGSVFVGQWTSKSSGDYATGANHVLPTGGAAQMFSGLNVEMFGKWIEYQQVSQTGLTNIRQTIETFAEVEELPAHRLSTSIRFPVRKS
jgi:histidinol dehydrogenase